MYGCGTDVAQETQLYVAGSMVLTVAVPTIHNTERGDTHPF